MIYNLRNRPGGTGYMYPRGARKVLARARALASTPAWGSHDWAIVPIFEGRESEPIYIAGLSSDVLEFERPLHGFYILAPAGMAFDVTWATDPGDAIHYTPGYRSAVLVPWSLLNAAGGAAIPTQNFDTRYLDWIAALVQNSDTVSRAILFGFYDDQTGASTTPPSTGPATSSVGPSMILPTGTYGTIIMGVNVVQQSTGFSINGYGNQITVVSWPLMQKGTVGVAANAGANAFGGVIIGRWRG